jgi:hypothetical protein
MQDDLTPILSAVLFLGLLIISFAVWRWRSMRLSAEERTSQQAMIDRGIRDGVLTPGGNRACIVCGSAATAYMPVSAASWMDNLPLLNRLFSLPPRYVIEDDTTEDVCLCRSHKEYSVKKLEEFHAMLRAERASFNARQADKVAQMDGGALILLVREQHRDAVRAMKSDIKTPLPQLVQMNRRDEQPVVTLVSTSAAPGPRDEQDIASGS